MIAIRVLLFARARDLAGHDSVSVPLPDDATVNDLRRALAKVVPALGDWLPRCAIAVNGDYAEDVDAVTSGSEVAVIPPVSGGS